MAALDVGRRASLDAAGYRSVVASGGAEEMVDFIRRVVLHDGGCIEDEKELRQMAARHAGEGAPVLSYRHLLAELRVCHWVDWVPAQRSLPEAAPCCEGGCGCSAPSAPPVCSAGQGHAVAPAASLGSDFLGGWTAEDLRPSAPLPPPAEAAAAPAVSEAGGCEARLDGRELGTAPCEELGGVAVFSPPWTPRYLLGSRPFVVVLRHPSDPTLGIRLFEDCNRASAVAVARQVAEGMQLRDGVRVAPELYHTLLCDSELRAALASLQGQGTSEAVSSGGSASSSSSPSPAAASAPAEPDVEGPGDCPICFSEIESTSAVMRCGGEGGVHHYFHSGCMQRWIAQCRSGRAGPTCPVCRGQIQFHAQRLEAFLSSSSSAELPPEDRGFLEQCADRLRGSGAQWGEVFTLENAKYWGGIAAAGGWGFMIGYMGSGNCLHNQLILNNLPQEHRIAQGTGWVLGILARAFREHQRQKRRRQEEQCRR